MMRTVDDSSNWAAVVLAAGRGARMGTTLPKPLHTVSGVSLIQRTLNVITDTGIASTTIVRGPSPSLPSALGLMHPYVTQDNINGTGGALQALFHTGAPNADSLLILNVDVPLITAESLHALCQAHLSATDSVLTFLTYPAPSGSDAGRVARDADGNILEIVEAHELQGPNTPSEGNVGIYALNSEWARAAVERLPAHGNGEFYMTDLVALAVRDGRGVQTVSIDAAEAIGVNTLADLAEAERLSRWRVLERLMLAGVRILDPCSTYIDQTVTISADTVIQPNTSISGTTTIGANCEIGPDTHIVDSVIGDGCVVRGAWLDETTLEDTVMVGPFARLRPGTHIGQETHIGSFGEIKGSRIGNRTAMGHFGYVGDAEIGDDVNIGAGAVTCNFDGVDKHRSVVGDGAFIGSGTLLVAPVEIGARAYTAAGSVVTRDVSAGTRVAGVPAQELAR